MKKVFSLIICFAIMLSLAACSREGTDNKEYLGFNKKVPFEKSVAGYKFRQFHQSSQSIRSTG